MSDSFKNKIKQWVTLDNEIKLLSDRIKEIKDERQEVNQDILFYVESNNLKTSTIQLSDGCLKFINNKTYTPLTFSFLEQCMKDIIPENEVEHIIQHIKHKRCIQNSTCIKRNIL